MSILSCIAAPYTRVNSSIRNLANYLILQHFRLLFSQLEAGTFFVTTLADQIQELDDRLLHSYIVTSDITSLPALDRQVVPENKNHRPNSCANPQGPTHYHINTRRDSVS